MPDELDKKQTPRARGVLLLVSRGRSITTTSATSANTSA